MARRRGDCCHLESTVPAYSNRTMSLEEERNSASQASFCNRFAPLILSRWPTSGRRRTVSKRVLRSLASAPFPCLLTREKRPCFSIRLLPVGAVEMWESRLSLARFPRGCGKRGKPAFGFPRFPQPRHFHSSLSGVFLVWSFASGLPAISGRLLRASLLSDFDKQFRLRFLHPAGRGCVAFLPS